MRKINVLLAVLIMLTMLFTSSVAYASQSERNFVVQLSGAAERPTPVETNARGVAIFHLSKDGTELSYKLIVANIEDVTQAHIHCGSEDVAGPVVAFLFHLVPTGVTVNGVLAEGTITADDVIARAPSPECPTGVADFEELLALIRSGDAYVNVHTLANPGGEIRGQFD